MSQEFKFFRDLGSSRGSKPDPKLASIVALLLTISVVSGLMAIQNSPMGYNMKADPAVWDAIVHNDVILATVAYQGDLNIKDYAINVYKIWHFGDLKIAYVRVDGKDLENLVKNDNVLRVFAWGKIKLPPYKYIVKNKGVTYDFTKDYKRLYHKANDKWTGKGVTIAVIDTGIDYLHPDFYKNGKTIIKALVTTLYHTPDGKPIVVDTEGYNYSQMLEVYRYELQLKNETHGTDMPFADVVGHGTHCAGIIAGQGVASGGRYMGIAPDAKLVIIKAFVDKGYAYENSILDALQWVYDNADKYGIKVLSCSWGAPSSSPVLSPIELAMKKLIEDKGIVIFCASGNEGALPSTVVSPAKAPFVFAVGAIDPYADKLAVFSSCGDPVFIPFGNPNYTKPDFVGAGVDIIAPASEFADFPPYAIIHGHGGNYVIMSGTSMATPSVASVYACFYQWYTTKYGKEPTRQDFINYVRHYGIVYNPVSKDFVTGWGAPVVPPPS